jgi:hypothetical protein
MPKWIFQKISGDQQGVSLFQIPNCMEAHLVAKNVRVENLNLLIHCVTDWATIINLLFKTNFLL